MFDEALGRLQALGDSAAAILPGLLLGMLVFGLGLVLVRGVRAAVTRAASLREASTGRRPSWAHCRGSPCWSSS